MPRMEHPLRQFRRDKQVSAAELARQAGTTRQTVHRIETGAQRPSLDLVRRLVDATDHRVRADDFVRALEQSAH